MDFHYCVSSNRAVELTLSPDNLLGGHIWHEGNESDERRGELDHFEDPDGSKANLSCSLGSVGDGVNHLCTRPSEETYNLAASTSPARRRRKLEINAATSSHEGLEAAYADHAYPSQGRPDSPSTVPDTKELLKIVIF